VQRPFVALARPSSLARVREGGFSIHPREYQLGNYLLITRKHKLRVFIQGFLQRYIIGESLNEKFQRLLPRNNFHLHSLARLVQQFFGAMCT